MSVPTRLDIRHIRNHALHAIAGRLCHPAPEALLAAERDGDAVILRLNSGGNAIAVESYLNLCGYLADDAGKNPDGYGCAVRVRLQGKA